MGLTLYTDKKSYAGMSMGTFHGLVEDICDYLRDHFHTKEQTKAINALENYRVGEKYNISQEDCKVLFEMMVEDEDADLRSYFHNEFRYEYAYPIHRLMFHLMSDWKRSWDKWNLCSYGNESLSANMGEMDYRMMADMNAVNDRHRFYVGLDYWVNRICSESTPIEIILDEPMGGEADGRLEALIVAVAAGAMHSNGLHIS